MLKSQLDAGAAAVRVILGHTRRLGHCECSTLSVWSHRVLLVRSKVVLYGM
jgi:hypothetical protein